MADTVDVDFTPDFSSVDGVDANSDSLGNVDGLGDASPIAGDQQTTEPESTPQGEQTPDAQQPAQTDQQTPGEVLTLPDGRQVSLNDVKAWEEAAQNRDKWQQSNTQEAQRLAQMRQQVMNYYQQLQAYQSRQTAGPGGGQQQGPPQFLSQLTPEQQEDLRYSNPQAYQQLQQNEIRTQAAQFARQEVMARQTQQAILTDMPDFQRFVNRDPALVQELTPYLQKYAGISPSNAFFLHQIDGLKTQIQAAKEEGVKEGEARAQKAFKTNRGMTTVTGGKQTPAPAADPNRSIEDAEADMVATLRAMRGGNLNG